MGAILRTSSENATEEDIKNDIKDLLELVMTNCLKPMIKVEHV